MEKLNNRIRELINRHGKDYKSIAELLNKDGFTSPTGREWNNNSLRVYVGRHPEITQVLVTDSHSEISMSCTDAPTHDQEINPQETTPLKEWPPFLVELRPDISKFLIDAYEDGTLKGLTDLYRTGGLRDTMKWREHNQSVPMQAVEYRPLFKGDRKNTGIHCNEEILERAVEKASKEKARTGGSLSKLVELLLWRYIGSPQDLVESPRSLDD